MLKACQTGDERVVREIVSSLPDSVGFVLDEVDFLFFVLFFLFFSFKLFLVFVTLFVVIFLMMLINSYLFVLTESKDSLTLGLWNGSSRGSFGFVGQQR